MAIDYGKLAELVEELENIEVMRSSFTFDYKGRTMLALGCHTFELDGGFGDREIQRCTQCGLSFATPAAVVKDGHCKPPTDFRLVWVGCND